MKTLMKWVRDAAKWLRSDRVVEGLDHFLVMMATLVLFAPLVMLLGGSLPS